MITATIIIMSLCSYALSHMLNPIKMSMTLMLLSSMTFFSMYIKSGNTWLPMLFFMLFMGGILIVFMIISSVMPNEKIISNKMIDYLWVVILITMSLFMLMTTKPVNLYNMQMKWLFNSSVNMTFIMMLIMVYFIIFVSLVSSEKMSLRSEACQ